MTDEQVALLAAVTLLAPHMDPRDLLEPTPYTMGRISEWAAVMLHTLHPWMSDA